MEPILRHRQALAFFKRARRAGGSISGDASMEGEDRETGLCSSVKTVTPTRGWARLSGTHRLGSDVMSLATQRVETVSTGQLTPCHGVTLPAPSAEYSVVLHTDTVRRQPDGTFRASAKTQTMQGASFVSNEFSLVLHPGYCGHGTDRGGLFALSATGVGPKIHASHSATSPAVYLVPNGSRLIYDRVLQVDGETWFHVSPQARPAGWVSGADVACRRPGEPPPLLFPPSDLAGARPTAAQVAGDEGNPLRQAFARGRSSSPRQQLGQFTGKIGIEALQRALLLAGALGPPALHKGKSQLIAPCR